MGGAAGEETVGVSHVSCGAGLGKSFTFYFQFDWRTDAPHNSPYTPLFPRTSPNFPSHPKPNTASTLVQRHGLATQLLVALLARLLPLAHDLNTTSSSALVATASAAANLCCRRPRTCSAVRPPTKSCQSCLVSCLRCRAHLFLLRPPPRLPPPRPHGR